MYVHLPHSTVKSLFSRFGVQRRRVRHYSPEDLRWRQQERRVPDLGRRGSQLNHAFQEGQYSCRLHENSSRLCLFEGRRLLPPNVLPVWLPHSPPATRDGNGWGYNTQDNTRLSILYGDVELHQDRMPFKYGGENYAMNSTFTSTSSPASLFPSSVGPPDRLSDPLHR